MRRTDLEHIIRAAAAITNQYEFVVIGSQSILGAAPNAPDDLTKSCEADIYPLGHADLADLIDGSIGELSPFHFNFGYYAQGVGPETAKLPKGWEGRLVKIQNSNTDLKIGYCLELNDLAASKLAAGREKDYQFVKGMINHGMVDKKTLVDRIQSVDISPSIIAHRVAWVDRMMETPSDLKPPSKSKPFIRNR